MTEAERKEFIDIVNDIENKIPSINDLTEEEKKVVMKLLKDEIYKFSETA